MATSPFGREVVVIESGGVIVMARGLIWVCAVGSVLSLARTEKRKLPAAVGIPERVPSDCRASPAGGSPEARVMVYGGVPPPA